MKQLCSLFLLFSTGFFSIACSKNNTTNPDIISPDSLKINYIADDVSIFPNPERGWYDAFNPFCCDDVAKGLILAPHDPIVLSPLQRLRSSENAITLVRDVVKIQQYTGPIPQARLDAIQADMNTYRQAGMKVLFRICYNYGMTTGEPAANIISAHLEQLAPILQNNADVIFEVQAGMFGGSGEGCCGSFQIQDGEGSEPAGYNNEWSSLKTSGKTLYNKLIDIVPSDRFVTLRYPRYKYQIMDWSNSDVSPVINFPLAAVPLTEAIAYNGTKQARLGFYHDCFAGDRLGYGFFNAWEQKDIDFTAADTKYALMEGELSAGTEYNKANGLGEMSKFHFTAFHISSEGGVTYEDLGTSTTIASWKASGQYDQMARMLGYRFRLISSTIPQTKLISVLKMNLRMANDGWARIMNPRKVEIIFKNKATGEKYEMDIDGDGRGNRLWLPGPGETKMLEISKPLPAGIPAGEYELFLNLPDPYPSLHNRPEYSIRLANKNVWDEATGYNSLLCKITV